MTTYARMQDGVPVEVFPPVTVIRDGGDAVEVPITERFAPDFVAGLVVVPDGTEPQPLPVDPPPPHDQLVEQAKAAIRAERQPIIGVLDGLQSSALVKGEAELAQAIEAAKQGLRDLTDIDLSACATYEEMRLAVKARYLQLAAGLPVDVRIAFSEAVS